MCRTEIGPLGPTEALPCLQCPICMGERFRLAISSEEGKTALLAECDTQDCEGYRVRFALRAGTRQELERWPGMLYEGEGRVLAERPAS